MVQLKLTVVSLPSFTGLIGREGKRDRFQTGTDLAAAKPAQSPQVQLQTVDMGTN